MGRGAWVLLLFFLCGCPALPREVELSVTLGEQEVQVHAALRDIQILTREPAEALQVFHGLHAPDEVLSPQVLRSSPWLPRVQVWEWRVRGEALDLDLMASMPRSQFDACVATPHGERKSAHEDPSRCPPFLWREGNAYRSLLDLSSREWFDGKWTWTLQGPTRWPLQDRRLQTRLVLKTPLPPAQSISALPSFELHSRDPEAVSTYKTLLDRLKQEFSAGHTSQCVALQSEAARVLPPHLRSLFQAQTRRERLLLLRRLLLRQGILPAESIPLPLFMLSLDPEHYGSLIPRRRPPEELLLRLARLYDRSAARFGVDCENDREDFSSWLDESELQGICQELGKKAPSWRRPCQHLVDTRP